jgi:hypothetical protein
MFWAVKLSIKCTLWGTNWGIDQDLNFLFDAQPKVIGEVSQSEAKMNTKF